MSPQAIPINPNEVEARTLRWFRRRECYFGDADCSATKILSHSMPRASLTKISEDGHVLRFATPHFQAADAVYLDEQIPPTKVGLGKVGTYHGFCSHHDNSLFAPIEDQSIDPSPHQAALLHFRALTWELYVKSETLKISDSIKDIAQSKPARADRELLNLHGMQFYLAAHKTVSENVLAHQVVAADLRSGDFTGFHSIAWRFNEHIPVNICAYCNPMFDLECHLFQDYDDLSINMRNFAITALNLVDQGLVIVTWRSPDDFTGYFRPLLKMADAEVPGFLLQLMFALGENHAFSRSWWHRLSVVRRRRLMRIYLEDIVNGNNRQCFRSLFRRCDFSMPKLASVCAT